MTLPILSSLKVVLSDRVGNNFIQIPLQFDKTVWFVAFGSTKEAQTFCPYSSLPDFYSSLLPLHPIRVLFPCIVLYCFSLTLLDSCSNPFPNTGLNTESYYDYHINDTYSVLLITSQHADEFPLHCRLDRWLGVPSFLILGCFIFLHRQYSINPWILKMFNSRLF